jgi:hypothetical protein
MLIYLDPAFEVSWRTGKLYRYRFDSSLFEDCHDHGVWVSRADVCPAGVETLTDLPTLAQGEGVDVRVEPLLDVAGELYDFASGQFRTTLHVSMIRMALLNGWPGSPGVPVAPLTST